MRERRTARLIMINERDEVFLFHNSTDARHGGTYWVTPGGGSEAGETWEAGALRELWEETGIAGFPLGPVLWTRTVARQNGTLLDRQRYYLVRVREVEISVSNQFDYERLAYQSFRWWSLDDLASTGEIVYPDGLANLIAPVLQGKYADPPIDITEVQD